MRGWIQRLLTGVEEKGTSWVHGSWFVEDGMVYMTGNGITACIWEERCIEPRRWKGSRVVTLAGCYPEIPYLLCCVSNTVQNTHPKSGISPVKRS